MRSMTVNLPGRGYDVLIGSGLLKTLSNALPENKAGKIGVITDSTVRPLYAEMVLDQIRLTGREVFLLEIPAGESSKTMQMAEHCCASLLDWEFGRQDLLAALGGGVVGDLTGLVASLYMRGIRYIQLPTTLLAQIDSAIGGKTAVDLEKGKNIVGTFWQPELVLADTDVLRSLPRNVLRDGLAEMVKYALLQGGDLYETVRAMTCPEDFYLQSERLVAACAEMKCGIVQRDECENGERMLLNLGHTLGHCVESYYHYARYTHGEAVAIGLAEILRYGEAEGETGHGLAEEVETLLKRLDLPTSVEADRRELYQGILHDKKGKGKAIHVVLPQEPGKVVIRVVSKEDFLEKVVSLK